MKTFRSIHTHVLFGLLSVHASYLYMTLLLFIGGSQGFIVAAEKTLAAAWQAYFRSPLGPCTICPCDMHSCPQRSFFTTQGIHAADLQWDRAARWACVVSHGWLCGKRLVEGSIPKCPVRRKRTHCPYMLACHGDV